MTQYGVLNAGWAVLLTERPYGDYFFHEHTGCEIYGTLSDAVEAFDGYNLGNSFIYSKHGLDYISVVATSQDNVNRIDDFDGPYDDVLLAYGVQHIKGISENYREPFFSEFDLCPGARMIFDYKVSVPGFEHCRVRTAQRGISLNIEPLNDPCHIKSGQELRLRLTGRTDNVGVFETPDTLTAETHLPPYILIPLGIYHSNLQDQETSVVVTGQVTRAYLVSEHSERRYIINVQTMDLEIDLDVFTYYTIKAGDYIFATTKLSAFFPR